MSRLLIFGILILATSTAFASRRPLTLNMTCAEAQALVSSSRSIGLQTGKYTYDRYVASPGFCDVGQRGHQAAVPTKDTDSCWVGYTCDYHPDLFEDH